MTLWQAATKRGIDIVLSALGLLVFGWLIVIACVAAGIDTNTSGIFRQERVGRYGRPFHIIKLRTMRTGFRLDTTVTTSADLRITRLGRLLRQCKIDELPQLVNILIGDMSFVGPRPDVKGFADRLEGEARQVLTVRPGLTGPATLHFRNEEDLLQMSNDPERYNRDVVFPEKVRLNLDYVRNYGLLQDFKIIWMTLFRW